MIEVRQLEWLNHNSQRAYPLADDATQQDATGTFSLPQDFIVELELSIHAGHNVDPAAFFIMNVACYAAGYSIVVGYNASNGAIPVATALITAAAMTKRNVPFRLGGLGNFLDATGHVTIGTLDSISQQPSGQWTLTYEGGRLEQDALLPNIRNITSIQVQNGTELSDRIYGDVILQAGTNYRITPVLEEGMDAVLILDAISGAGLSKDCICVNNALDSCIRTIDRIGPTPDGDFTILGNDCLQVQPIANGVQLVDTCSQPCCGCKELETVTAALAQFGAQATTLENFLVSLEARVTQMDQVVLGSTLGDRGCITCQSQQGGS